MSNPRRACRAYTRGDHCRLGQARVAQRLRLGSRAAELAREAADLFERLGDLDRAYEARELH